MTKHDCDDVFADIVNGTIADGEQIVRPEDLVGAR